MARYLIEAGVPEEDLLLESRSTSTRENFDFSLELLRRRGLSADTPILFVTNRFHCYRAAGYGCAGGLHPRAGHHRGHQPHRAALLADAGGAGDLRLLGQQLNHQSFAVSGPPAGRPA